MMAPRTSFPSAILCLAGLFLRPVNAQETNINSSAATSMVVTAVKKETIPKLPPVMRAYASVGTNKCAFLVPRGFRLETLKNGTISVVATDNSCFITLRRMEEQKQQTLALTTKTCRPWVLEQYREGKILSEFSRSVAGQSGPAFDLQAAVPGGGSQKIRIAYIPLKLGILEFKLVAAPNKFRSATYKFNNLLLSFHVSKKGKLEVVPLSNKF